MDDREIDRRLKGFEAVWKRVGAAKSAAAAAEARGLKLMPGQSGSRRRPYQKFPGS